MTTHDTAGPLAELAPEIWSCAREQRFWGLETGTRMTVVRLSDGSLFVHGPVALDVTLRRAVDALGPVRALVCSSLFHHLYAAQWVAAYPDALLCGCPGLDAKRPDLRFAHILGNEPLAEWGEDLDQVYFSARFEHEVVFFHRKTRTLISLDALINLSTHPNRMTRVAAFLMANSAPGKGYLERVAVGSRTAARSEVRRILEWDFDRVILAHGACVEARGREVFLDAYKWLKP